MHLALSIESLALSLGIKPFTESPLFPPLSASEFAFSTPCTILALVRVHQGDARTRYRRRISNAGARALFTNAPSRYPLHHSLKPFLTPNYND